MPYGQMFTIMYELYLTCLRITSPKSGTSGTPDDNWKEPVKEKEFDEEDEAVDVINFEFADSVDLDGNT